MHNIQSMHNIRNSKLFEIFELNELNLISGDLNKRGEGVRRTSREVVYLSNYLYFVLVKKTRYGTCHIIICSQKFVKSNEKDSYSGKDGFFKE